MTQPRPVLVGTSGYSYPPWKGRFYPGKIRADAMLAFYAERLDTVELNHTFYEPPAAGALTPLAAQVGPDFVFAVKAPQRITHHLRLRGVGDELAGLERAVRGLGRKAGPVLYQLPHNMKRDDALLAEFLAQLPPSRPAAFEFRHASWLDERVFDLLHRSKRALCVAETEDLVTPRVLTAGWAYLRLRRERYGDKSLAEWAAWIAAQPVSRAFVYFMHEDTARGPRYAKRLARLLSATGKAEKAR